MQAESNSDLADFIPCELASGVKFGLEPAAAICQPPTYHANRNRRSKCPPQWQAEIRDDAQDGESSPEDFPFHSSILDSNVLSIRWTYREVVLETHRSEVKKTKGARPRAPSVVYVIYRAA